MKSEFKTKLIQHILNKKNGEKGFTLIELLVVIIIIGILAAIALPSFLNQASKARQSEAKTYTGSMNRSQQAYYLEKQEFAPNLTTLAIGIAQTTANYAYGVARTGGKAATGTSQAVGSFGAAGPTTPTAGSGGGSDTVVTLASSPLKSYVGAVSLSTPTGSNEATTLAALCETNLAAVNSGTIIASTNMASTYLTINTGAAPVCINNTSGIQ
ncbi:type IV pilin-like G/H family protein [Pseudanabaena sp. UWO310]|uniref:type IV pilin-like G/H family protein n=1 Tax=Pseudanabaena sp. UWO310 TaxID=2480795 RepID=UPI001157F88B|nr:type IV pilin-like G/H family protein [Pseudanabaena sp. UWO310]TYQ27067.1 prepilin-type N-terminal cleavage/methylation domain-containing protein [Pseudanabaena sp. UWO310]